MDKKKVAAELVRLAKVLVARTPAVGDEIRFNDTDGLISVDTIYDVFGTEVETENEHVFDMRKSRFKWKGNHWFVA